MNHTERRRKFCVVTGSRAEYGLLYWLMKEIQADDEVLLQTIVTGSHLSKVLGFTHQNIERDGFRISKKIPILDRDDSVVGISSAIGRAVRGFARTLNDLKPDLLIVLGDRYEIHAAVTAALIAKIPVAHIAGGDITEGSFDNSLRHSITKMSHLHFVTHADAARRVAQMGEDERFIFNVGNPGLDHLRRSKLMSKREVEKALGFAFRQRNLLITFHPVTLAEGSSVSQLKELLVALGALGKNIGLIFSKPNADPEGLKIAEQIDVFVAKHSNATVCTSMGQILYLSAMRQVDAVLGNSSSGIYEAPSFKIPTVNIGDRQKGRLQAPSVINCEPRSETIAKAVARAFRMDCSKIVNPYGNGTSSKQIFAILKSIPNLKSLLQKRFIERALFPSPGRVYVIAEAGVNHNGSVAMARKLVDAAKHAGANAIKFQSFQSTALVTPSAPKALYQEARTGSKESQFEMLKKLELDRKAHLEISAYCRQKKIDFLSTPFDAQSVDLLVRHLEIKKLKISSGDLTNAPLLLRMARSGLPLILSTGMSTLGEVEDALKVLAYGYTACPTEKPTQAAFDRAYQSSVGQDSLAEKVTLLHCTTAYPASFDEVNLRAMDSLRFRFGLPTGLSDHSPGMLASIAAAARGACVIEKHLTLDRSLQGPDHQASLEPGEFKDLVSGIRVVERTMGSPEKGPTPSEKGAMKIVRRSIVASRPIKKGESFAENNIAIKRPGGGLSPMHYWSLLGKRASRSYRVNEVIVHE